MIQSLWTIDQNWPIKSGRSKIADLLSQTFWPTTSSVENRTPLFYKNVLSVDVMNMFLLCYIQWQTHLYIHLYLLTVFPRSANILFIKWSFDLRRNWQHRYRPLSYENKHDLLSTSKYFGKYRQMPLRTIYFPVLRIPRRFLSGIQRSTQNFYPRIKLSDIPIYWNIIYHVSVFC